MAEEEPLIDPEEDWGEYLSRLARARQDRPKPRPIEDVPLPGDRAYTESQLARARYPVRPDNLTWRNRHA